ncbi:MAG: hypothetical protein KDE33_17755, partial [Bacteroidetes bacterium]|nr:hypothetical protein [Bacteroidota bacterium]
MKKIITTLFSFMLIFAYSQEYWQKTSSFRNSENAQIKARNAQNLNLNINAFTQEMFTAPQYNGSTLSSVIVDIPLPNGNFEKYMVYESLVMEQGLADKFPQIKTFIVQSIENQLNTGRVDVTTKGFHALIYTQ